MPIQESTGPATPFQGRTEEPAPALRIDGGQAIALAREICFPRFPGTQGERRALGILGRAIEALGYTVREQPFECDPTKVDGLRRLLPLALAADFVLFTAVGWFAPTAGWIGVTCSLAAFTMAGRRRAVERLLAGTRCASANLVAIRPAPRPFSAPGAPRRRVLFLAHVDSKSQRIGFVARTATAGALLLFACGAWAALGLHALGWAPRAALPAAAACGIAMLCLSVPLALNANGNRSAGALDNAAACGTLVEIARLLARRGEAPYEPAFALTGAEEIGMVGASVLAREGFVPGGPLDGAPAGEWLFVNLDGIGAGSAVLALVHGPSRGVLRGALRRAGRKAGVRLRFARLLPAAGVDGAALGAHGLRGVTLLSWSLGRAARCVHAPGDLPENLDPVALENAARLALQLAEDWGRSGLGSPRREG